MRYITLASDALPLPGDDIKPEAQVERRQSAFDGERGFNLRVARAESLRSPLPFMTSVRHKLIPYFRSSLISMFTGLLLFDSLRADSSEIVMRVM
jgi:hypothetical protein